MQLLVWIPLALPKFSPYRNGEFSLYRKLYATKIKVDYSNFHNLERFTVHFNPGTLNSKLLIFINSKNLRTTRKLITYENFQDYSICEPILYNVFSHILLRTMHLAPVTAVHGHTPPPDAEALELVLA